MQSCPWQPGCFARGRLPELAMRDRQCWLNFSAVRLIEPSRSSARRSPNRRPPQVQPARKSDSWWQLTRWRNFSRRRRSRHRASCLCGSWLRSQAAGSSGLIATIRSDFFHRCGEVPGFSALKDGLGSYELLPPTGPEIAQIIREPARTAGLRYEESADRGRLDDVLQEAAAADPGSLPLLEFVLDALYEAGRERRVLTFAAYRALGGLEGAIARRADEVVDALSPDIQEVLPPVLRALTTVHPGDETVTASSGPAQRSRSHASTIGPRRGTGGGPAARQR